jgi:hypothetical protein
MVMGGPWKDQRLPTPDSRLWFIALHLTTTAKEANVDAEDLQALLNNIEVKSKNNSLAKIMCRSPGQASFTRSL